MFNLVHMVAVQQPFWAVLADKQGNPDLRLVVALGTMQDLNDPDQKRIMAGYALGDHLNPVDFDPAFVGFTDDKDGLPLLWFERCLAKRDELTKRAAEAEANKNKPQIIVPGERPIVPVIGDLHGGRA